LLLILPEPAAGRLPVQAAGEPQVDSRAPGAPGRHWVKAQYRLGRRLGPGGIRAL